MKDSCVEFCRLRSARGSVFQDCMLQQCGKTEPTAYNPEWPLTEVVHPDIRLDYILISDSLLQDIMFDSNQTEKEKEQMQPLIAGVDIEKRTHTISDHYPVFIRWMDRHYLLPHHRSTSIPLYPI